MFGEYAQIATYLPPTRDSLTPGGDFAAANLPSHLVPSPLTAPAPWGGQVSRGYRTQGGGVRDDKNHVDDFIMVAEFSEIEGPKPVLTIPKDAGESVDQNALSVKLMAVDHQTSSEGFSISEDTQVVLSDDEAGVSAFVHHFVLYDNQARGFVRPYCMVFISTDLRKIMMFYEELSSQFKRAARFLKYGNRLLFVKDLERHLQDLEHTKGYLLNQVSRMRLKETGDPAGSGGESKTRTNTENELYKGLQNIRQSSTEIKDILSILKPLLHDRRLESRFRVLEERAFQRGSEDVMRAEKLSLQEDWFSDNMYAEGSDAGATFGSLKESGISPVSLFNPVKSHTPLLVETKKAKRFNSPLRGLHELCSWGAKEGLRKLRCIHEYFRKDAMVLEIERNESRLMEPASSMITHGQCVTSNFLASIAMQGSSLCMSEDSSSLLQAAERLRRWPSIASNDTLESFKSVDSYLSIQDEENASLLSFCSNNSSPGVTTSTSGQDFLSAPTSPLTEEVAPILPNDTARTSVTSSSSRSDINVPGSAVNNHQNPPSSTANTSKDTAPSCDENHDQSTPKFFIDTTQGLQISELSHERQKSADSEQTIPGGNATHLLNGGASCTVNVKDLSQSGSTSETESVKQRQQAGQESEEEKDSSTSMPHGVEAQEDTSHSNARSPSFVPMLMTTPAQQIRDADREHQPSPESKSETFTSSAQRPDSLPNFQGHIGVPRDLEKLKLEFSESFKSLGDAASEIDETWCDLGNGSSVDGPSNGRTPSTPSSDPCLWKPRHGVYTAGDVINALAPGRPGYGISDVLASYGNLQSVLFSLMTGRTVLVVGPARMEQEVTKVVTALSIFLSDTKRKHHCVVDWMNRQLKVTDLTRICLAGVCRSEKRSLDATIPTAVKQYSTILDVERRMLTGPPYQGTLLHSVLQQKKSFRTDAQYLAYIH
ncbi:hypothetical protein BaRGS_00008669, partial [Batillaria attramentaria]